ncbi:hypothetical protein AB9P05_02950 [Roseivirga sp. BDSF3-8]|uniref:hypothetical protein n=1 Tax=Roseivirga sp. BDSF3-8 TaxID=3241598 RepID=UPI0035320303
MSELWLFFRQDYWEKFQKDVVENELPKHLDFLNELEKVSPFDEDINRALASLSSYMFKGEITNFKKWLVKGIPALGGKSPQEVSQDINGMDWIREFILRTP